MNGFWDDDDERDEVQQLEKSEMSALVEVSAEQKPTYIATALLQLQLLLQ